jgi:serine/threonine protein kinase/beta-lactam-binding protein with PASTA domain
VRSRVANPGCPDSAPLSSKSWLLATHNGRVEALLMGYSPSMTSTIAPEVVLAGRYRLVHWLATGGMGQVWRAADEVLGRPVAVKLLRSEYARDPAFLDRFRTEARCTAGLSHPGIANVYDYGEVEEPDPTAYLVMELVEGAPLSALLAREGRLDPERVLDVIAQAALALGSAHQAGVVHRDVKPSNLLIRRDGVVKVTDFGISRTAGEAPRTETGVVVGTAAYLSPEQVACRPATPASDVYALGVVAYECLAGRRPFTGEHPIALALAHQRHRPPPLPPDVPEPARALVDLAMAKDLRVRPPNASVLARRVLMTRAALVGRSRWSAATGRGGSPGDPAAGPDAPAPTANGSSSADRNGSARANGHRSRRDGHAPVTDPEQDTSQWTPASLVFMRLWSWFRQRRPATAAAMVAVLALLAAAVTGAATTQRGSTVAVPSVVGLRSTTAGQVLARAGFEVRQRAQPDRYTRAGTVLSQDPTAGVRLARGGLVILTVSTGPADVILDPSRYLGEPLDGVRSALIRLGLRVNVETRPADGEPGTVIGINPTGALRQGDAVTVTVAAPNDPQSPDLSAAPVHRGEDQRGSRLSDRGHVKKGKHGDRRLN